MRKLITLIGLELYAIALAFVQLHNGVRTDEAKYLLNIPYPHPPLARSILGFFDGWVWQEHAARILFATLMVQAVWIVWDMGRALKPSGRIALAALWLGSAAFLLQTGTVMMAPLTALQALLFLWMLSLPKHRVPGTAAIALLWLVTLFTALQGALLLPLVIAVLRLKGVNSKTIVWCIVVPVALVVLYALGNPFLLSSLFLQAGKDATSTLADRGLGLGWVLVLAGSGIGTVVGILGLILNRHWWILASFALVAAYVFLGRFDYYAILFLPFFVTGAAHLYRRAPIVALPAAIILLACTALLLTYHEPLFTARSPARYVLGQLDPGTILLKGSFGHEWQYEAMPGQDVRLYSAQLTGAADVVVCFDDCTELEEDGWVENLGGLVHTWYKG